MVEYRNKTHWVSWTNSNKYHSFTWKQITIPHSHLGIAYTRINQPANKLYCLKFKIILVPCAILSTHWGRVTHICISKLIIIGSDNGLSPERCQAIIWTIAGILLIGTNFSQILSEIHTFSFKKMHLKMSSGKCRPSCLCLNVLK